MIEQKDIDLLFKIANFIHSRTSESIQDYKSNEKLIGYVVRYIINGQINAIWFDVEKLSERDLRFIFKHHKESKKQFFINHLDDFYRIGFKI